MSANKSVFITVLLAIAGGCRESQPDRAVEVPVPPIETLSLSVEGRENRTPFLASKGEDVAAAWSADGDGVTDLFLATSADGGQTFSEPRRVNDVPGDVNVYGEQPPRVALGGGIPAPIYVTWTSANREKKLSFLRFSRSLDGGERFEPAVTLHSPDLPGDRGWHSLSVSPTGEVHAVWLDARPDGADGADGQRPMGLFHLAWNGVLPPDGKRLFDPVCECCKTTMAIGNDGSVYAAWRHIYEDNYRDIAFSASHDGGVHFGEAVRVNEDGWQINGCPDDGPSMVVDANDRVHLIWPTLVRDRMDMGIFYASTKDGLTFSPRAPLPTAGGTDPSHPQMALDRSGNLVAVWDEVVEQKRRIVMTRSVPTGNGGLSWSKPLLLDEAANGASASYPVPAAAGTGVLVAWTSQTQVESVIRIRRVE